MGGWAPHSGHSWEVAGSLASSPDAVPLAETSAPLPNFSEPVPPRAT